MPIKLVTAVETSASAGEAWMKQYQDWSDTNKFADGKTKGQVQRALFSEALTPSHVAKVLNTGWAYPRCGVCEQHVDAAINVAEDFSDDVVTLCASCIEKAATIIKQVPNGTAKP